MNPFKFGTIVEGDPRNTYDFIQSSDWSHGS